MPILRVRAYDTCKVFGAAHAEDDPRYLGRGLSVMVRESASK